jgi:hypothetical protein
VFGVRVEHGWRRVSLIRVTAIVEMLASIVVVPRAAGAQVQATIAGSVKDGSAVLPGVTVEVASPVLIEKARTVVTVRRIAGINDVFLRAVLRD